MSTLFDMNRRLRHIEHLLDRLITLVERIMPTLDDILADVTQEKTDIASVSTLIKGLKQQIADALSGVTLSPDVQAKVDAIFTGAESNKADIAAAIASGS